MVPSFVVGGLCPGFSLFYVGRTWTTQSLVCISISFVLVIVEPRACQRLGIAWFADPCGISYLLLWFGSVSLSIELGFEFRPPLMLVIDFWFGMPVSLGVCSWLTWSLPGVSLSIDLKSLFGSLIADWAFANLYSITECTQLGPCWTKWPLALYWFRCIGSTWGSDAWHCDFSYCILLYHLCMIHI